MSELRHSLDVQQGDWIRERLAGFASGVTSLVPSGFEGYARILHPVPVPRRGPEQEEEFTTWAEVATRTARTMHPLVQFHAIAGPEGSAKREDLGVDGPREGELEPATLETLCRVLASHTTTPEHCWFALWEGYGWMQGSPAVAELVMVKESHPPDLPRPRTGRLRPPTKPGDPGYVPPAFPREVLQGPRFQVPQRGYFLFEGPLDAVGELGHRPSASVFFPQSPNLFWPEDRAWCVATEIDLDSTYVGGSEALAEALLAEPSLETWRVRPDDGIDAFSDSVNHVDTDRYGHPRTRRPPRVFARLGRMARRLVRRSRRSETR